MNRRGFPPETLSNSCCMMLPFQHLSTGSEGSAAGPVTGQVKMLTRHRIASRFREGKGVSFCGVGAQNSALSNFGVHMNRDRRGQGQRFGAECNIHVTEVCNMIALEIMAVALRWPCPPWGFDGGGCGPIWRQMKGCNYWRLKTIEARYGNKAVRAFLQQGYKVYPVN